MSKKFSEQKRASILRKLQDSELSAAEFCRRQGLCYGTVMGWRRREGGVSIPAPKAPECPASITFVEVDLVDGNRPQVANGESGMASRGSSSMAMPSKLCAELALPGGAVLRVYEAENVGMKNAATKP